MGLCGLLWREGAGEEQEGSFYSLGWAQSWEVGGMGLHGYLAGPTGFLS